MDGILATAVILGLMLLGLLLLARTWPRTSGLGGFGVRPGGGRSDRLPLDEERGTATPEEDDARWHWDEPRPDDREDR